jgi:cytochrome c oxidase assembly protein subunit 16
MSPIPKRFSSSKTFTRVSNVISRYPFLSFGLPFLSTMVIGSFLLSEMTQTRYDVSEKRVKAMKKEELLGMKGKKTRSLQEEYFVKFLFLIRLVNCLVMPFKLARIEIKC